MTVQRECMETMTEVLTTGEAAAMCGVSFRTVIRWIARGELQAYRLPGRGDHRVPRDELRRFMQAHGIPQADAPHGMPHRVLVTEDEPAMARAIVRVLRRAGFETAVASDGFLAGSLLHTFKPGLMTLDIRMPGIDGLGVLRVLQQQPMPYPLKILVISSDTDERLEQAAALGADGILRKPFGNDVLLAKVRQLFGERPSRAS